MAQLKTAPIACPQLLVGLLTTRAAPATTSSDEAPIPDGQRNNTLMSLAGRMRQGAFGEEAIALALLSVNAKRCRPPLPDDEVLRIAKSAMRFEAGPDPAGGHALTALLGLTTSQQPAPALAASVNPIAPQAAGGGSPLEIAKAAGHAPLLTDIAATSRLPIREYPTKYTTLDKLIGGGWLSGTLHVLLGPPAAGKTAFAVDAMLHHTREGKPGLYGCTELESKEITCRHAAPLLGVPWTKLERGEATINGVRFVGAALDAEIARVLAERRIHVYGSEVLKSATEAVLQLGLEVVRLTKLYGEAPLVVVDYLQDLARGVEAANVRGKIGDIATYLRGMSQISKDPDGAPLNAQCPVLAVSSVPRSWYGAAKAETMRNDPNAEVYLSAAKESGDVDYAAATVLFLDVAAPDGTGQPRPARIAVAKARRGESGFVGARFEGATGRWTDDPKALDEMTPEARKAKRVDAKLSEVETRIIELVTAHPLKYTATDLKKSADEGGAGFNKDTVKEAIIALLKAGRLQSNKPANGKFFIPGRPAQHTE